MSWRIAARTAVRASITSWNATSYPSSPFDTPRMVASRARRTLRK
ncbi:hypothetical protein [Streptomyces sp. NPDC057253]